MTKNVSRENYTITISISINLGGFSYLSAEEISVPAVLYDGWMADALRGKIMQM